MGGQHIDVPVLVHQKLLREGGGGKGELQGVLIHRLHPQLFPGHSGPGLVGAGQAGKGGAAQGLAGGIGHQGDGVHPVLGSHWGSVVEGRLLVQEKYNGIAVIGTLPTLRSSGLAGSVGLNIGQPVIELIVDDPGIVAPGDAVIGHQGIPGVGDAVVHIDCGCLLLGHLLGGLGLLLPAGGQEQAAHQGSGQGQGGQAGSVVWFQGLIPPPRR